MFQKVKALALQILTDINRIKIVLLLYISFTVTIRILFKTFCPIKAFTGFPCPGCGLTRSFFFLLSGNISDAIQMNASIFLWLFFLLYLFYMHYIKKKLPSYTLSILIMVCLFSFGLYMYRMLCFFPDTQPVLYHQGCFLYQNSSSYRLFIDKIILHII